MILPIGELIAETNQYELPDYKPAVSSRENPSSTVSHQRKAIESRLTEGKVEPVELLN